MTSFNPKTVAANMVKDREDAERFKQLAADHWDLPRMREAFERRAREFEYYAGRAEEWLDRFRDANKPQHRAA